MSDNAVEQRVSKANTNVRAWNVVGTAALMHKSDQVAVAMLQHLPAYSLASFAVIRGYLQAGTSPSDAAVTDINHAYVGIKIWLLLAKRQADKDEKGTAKVIAVWNELWPPFERLVELFISDMQVEGSSFVSRTTRSLFAVDADNLG